MIKIHPMQIKQYCKYTQQMHDIDTNQIFIRYNMHSRSEVKNRTYYLWKNLPLDRRFLTLCLLNLYLPLWAWVVRKTRRRASFSFLAFSLKDARSWSPNIFAAVGGCLKTDVVLKIGLNASFLARLILRLAEAIKATAWDTIILWVSNIGAISGTNSLKVKNSALW